MEMLPDGILKYIPETSYGFGVIVISGSVEDFHAIRDSM